MTQHPKHNKDKESQSSVYSGHCVLHVEKLRMFGRI